MELAGIITRQYLLMTNKIISLLAKEEPNALQSLINNRETIVPVLKYFSNQLKLPTDKQETIGIETTYEHFLRTINHWDAKHMNILVNKRIAVNDAMSHLISSGNWDDMKVEAIATGKVYDLITVACYGNLNIKIDLFDFIETAYATNPDVLRFIIDLNINYAIKLVK